MKLRVMKLHPDAQIPGYAHPGDAGMDLHALVECDIPAGESRTVGTGISIQLPDATEAQVRPRSGLASRYQITLLNTPGTVDCGYRGEIRVKSRPGGTTVQVTLPAAQES